MATRAATRLSAADWAAAALDLLKAEGVAAVQINRLCADLKVTRGSFYWHFADLAQLQAAVAARWQEETRGVLDELATVRSLPAADRLELLVLRLTDDSWWSVERAVRGWAEADDSVRAVVEEADRAALELVERALRDLGHPASEARVRAAVLVYAGIGFAHARDVLPTESEVRTLMRVVAGPAPGTS